MNVSGARTDFCCSCTYSVSSWKYASLVRVACLGCHFTSARLMAVPSSTSRLCLCFVRAASLRPWWITAHYQRMAMRLEMCFALPQWHFGGHVRLAGHRCIHRLYFDLLNRWTEGRESDMAQFVFWSRGVDIFGVNYLICPQNEDKRSNKQ